jgi:hypothetical protein
MHFTSLLQLVLLPAYQSVAFPHNSNSQLRDRESPPTAIELIDKGLKALGGEEALRQLHGVTYHAPRHATCPLYEELLY